MPELSAEDIAELEDELAGERAYRDSLRTALRSISDNGGADFVSITTPSGATRQVRYNQAQLTRLIGAANVRINRLRGRVQGKDWQSTAGPPTYRNNIA